MKKEKQVKEEVNEEENSKNAAEPKDFSKNKKDTGSLNDEF